MDRDFADLRVDHFTIESVAEDTRFERVRLLHPPGFKAGAFVHYASLPMSDIGELNSFNLLGRQAPGQSDNIA